MQHENNITVHTDATWQGFVNPGSQISTQLRLETVSAECHNSRGYVPNPSSSRVQPFESNLLDVIIKNASDEK